jgi:hypothetical protein
MVGFCVAFNIEVACRWISSFYCYATVSKFQNKFRKSYRRWAKKQINTGTARNPKYLQVFARVCKTTEINTPKTGWARYTASIRDTLEMARVSRASGYNTRTTAGILIYYQELSVVYISLAGNEILPTWQYFPRTTLPSPSDYPFHNALPRPSRHYF